MFVRSSLEALLATGRVLLADGATGTNYFRMGLEAGEPRSSGTWSIPIASRSCTGPSSTRALTSS